MLLAFYATLITFAVLAIITAIYWFYLIAQKKTTIGYNLLLITLLAFCSIIVAVFGYDFIQHQRGNTLLEAGECSTTYIRGGKSVDTTEVKLNGETYTIKSDKFKDLPDGTYRCEVAYLPITKYISEVHFETK